MFGAGVVDVPWNVDVDVEELTEPDDGVWAEARCGAAAEMITHPSEIRQIALTLLEADPEITTLHFALCNDKLVDFCSTNVNANTAVLHELVYHWEVNREKQVEKETKCFEAQLMPAGTRS